MGLRIALTVFGALALSSCAALTDAGADAANAVNGPEPTIVTTTITTTTPAIDADELQDAVLNCRIVERTLETASEAYTAQYGVTPVDQQQLVDGGLLSGATDGFEVTDGTVIIGPECTTLLAQDEARYLAEAAIPETDPEGCVINRRTFETAIEAYIITFGAPPATEADLVTSEMLRTEFVDFDLATDGSIVAVPGSICP